MSLYINYGSRVISLPYDATLGRMNGANADQLRVLIYICANDAFRADHEHNMARAVSDLHMAREDIEAAVKYWHDAKVLLDNAPKLEFIPEKKKKSGKLLMAQSTQNKIGETAELIDTDTDIRELIDALSRVFGKMLMSNEIHCLVSMYNYLHLPVDFLIELGKYCAEIEKKNVAYMSKMATTLFDEDIVTKDALVEYLQNMRRKNDITFKVKKLFGIGSRALVSKEKKFIELWFDEYGMTYEMIELAYEMTVNAIGEPKMDYCNGIIKKWVTSGIKTVDEAKAADEQYRATQTKKNASDKKDDGGSFDVDEFMELALKRSYNK